MIGILLPTEIESIRTRRDGSFGIVLGTPELSPEQGAKLLSLRKKVAFTYIKESDVQPDEMEMIDTTEPDMPGKSPSQRMRNVCYILWKQEPEGFENFTTYYQSKMEKLIDFLKNKITT